jgi:hypothetical protein
MAINCIVSVIITPDNPAIAVYAMIIIADIIAAGVYPISKVNLSKLAIATNCAARMKKKINMFTPLTVAENILENVFSFSAV